MAEITFGAPDTGPNAPNSTPVADPNRPEWLPQNFQKPEDLAKSYAELQAEFTKTKQALAAAKGEPDPSADTTATPSASIVFRSEAIRSAINGAREISERRRGFT